MEFEDQKTSVQLQKFRNNKRLCLRHPDQSVSHICITENVLFCDKCLTENNHYGDWYESEHIFLKNAGKCKKMLKEKVESVDKELNEAKQEILTLASLFVEELMKNVDEKVNSWKLEIDNVIKNIEDFKNFQDSELFSSRSTITSLIEYGNAFKFTDLTKYMQIKFKAILNEINEQAYTETHHRANIQTESDMYLLNCKADLFKSLDLAFETSSKIIPGLDNIFSGENQLQVLTLTYQFPDDRSFSHISSLYDNDSLLFPNLKTLKIQNWHYPSLTMITSILEALVSPRLALQELILDFDNLILEEGDGIPLDQIQQVSHSLTKFSFTNDINIYSNNRNYSFNDFFESNMTIFNGILQVAPKLKSLSFTSRENMFVLFYLQAIKKLKHLEELNITLKDYAYKETFVCLNDLFKYYTHLKSLSLEFNKVEFDKGVFQKMCSSLKNLKYLTRFAFTFRNPKNRASSLPHLGKAIQSLHYLKVLSLTISDSDSNLYTGFRSLFQAISERKALEELHLVFGAIKGALVEDVNGLPRYLKPLKDLKSFTLLFGVIDGIDDDMLLNLKNVLINLPQLKVVKLDATRLEEYTQEILENIKLEIDFHLNI